MTSTAICFFLEEFPKQLDQDEIIDILGQAKTSEWHETIVGANIDIFGMVYEESVVNFKRLKNIKYEIRHIKNNSFMEQNSRESKAIRHLLNNRTPTNSILLDHLLRSRG